MDEIHEVKQQRVDDPDGVAHCVRAVKRGVRLRRREEVGPAPGHSGTDVATFLADFLIPVFSAWSAGRKNTWKIGILREGSLLGEKVIYKERLAEGVDPERRFAELVELVRAGHLSNP